jgi:PAS domain S-box-containing protein
MEEYQTGISRIRELLSGHPDGLSITDIAGQLGMNRNSVAKYMDVLQIQGAVDGRKRGTSKVYFHSQRLPSSSIRKVCTRPLLIINQDGIIIDTNPQFPEFTQISISRLLKQPFETIPVKFLEGGSAQQIFKTCLRGIEQRARAHLSLGDRIYPVTFQVLPTVFENGKPGVAAIIDEDIICSGSPETESGSSELSISLDNQMEFIIRHTPDGIISYVNEPYCRAAGKTREDLLGRPYKPIVSAEDYERIRDHYNHLSIQYPVGMIEYRTIMANGEAQWQRWWDRALFNNRRELTGYFSCGIEITELVEIRGKLKKTKETLEETIIGRTDELREINRQLYTEMARREKMENQLLHTQFAMDNAADMVFWVDKNAGIKYANKAAVEMLGYTADQIQELHFGDIFPLYNFDKWNYVWEQLKHDRTISCETCLILNSRSEISVEVAIKYLEYHGTEFAFCFARDISDRTRMERALQLANKKLNVVSSITRHDIQNKITVLLGFLGRAKKMEKDSTILEYLNRQEMAAKAIRNEITMTRDFKDLGTEPPAWMKIKEIVSVSIRRYQDSPVNILIDLPDVEIYADMHLGRVFYRLFECEIRPEEQTDEILIFSESRDPGFVIIIQDNGRGIASDKKKDIFSMQNGDARFGGLFIAQEILSLTGITLKETGVYGNGTRFEIEIPSANYRYISK